jgi:hypothetical protein
MPSMKMPSIKMPSSRMPAPPESAPRALRILQTAQTAIAGFTILATIITIIFPFRYKLFTLSLLYTPILTSITTILFVVKEQKRAQAGTLSKQKYVKYQLLKMASAFGLSVIGFIGYLASAPHVDDPAERHPGTQGLWINGIKINKWQGLLIWVNFFNWYVLSS